ncbi:hypothetical protein [Altericroceibacterium endophyticum]|uniref:DUF3649 domain-containing protein n=1 Tax=Altericroceibacterium endophyticum TaxID=1808508 RepID=A0A6I4T655_9SPHN|nr:hypothetical protein [Altericroceibacterium endophyticum]MXO65899.1 hypothetical protein [Altericroceibacterium endophyticum]
MKPPLRASNWLGKASAGLVMGFLLALGAAGLLRTLVAGGATPFSTVGQFSMWMMAPVWALTVSLCFFFRTGPRAWVWLTLANGLVWGLVILLGGPVR